MLKQNQLSTESSPQNNLYKLHKQLFNNLDAHNY
jgi:hypothetical protein